MNWDWNGVINANSVVHISASECTLPNANNPAQCVRFQGSAPIWVANVKPHGPRPGDTITGGVEFDLVVEWYDNNGNPLPLNVMTDITVLDPPVIIQFSS
jgi:hypothetical protein